MGCKLFLPFIALDLQGGKRQNVLASGWIEGVSVCQGGMTVLIEGRKMGLEAWKVILEVVKIRL